VQALVTGRLKRDHARGEQKLEKHTSCTQTNTAIRGEQFEILLSAIHPITGLLTNNAELGIGNFRYSQRPGA
jgi:hypothetical protein